MTSGADVSDKVTMTRSWSGRADLEELFWDGQVVARPEGVTLCDRVVIADEIGRVIERFMGYADTAFEELTATTWARKTFQVPEPAMKDVSICIAGHRLRGRGKLAGSFNGVPFVFPARINCKWYSDWVILPAPGPLRRGRNELILHTTGSLVWRLYVEPCHLPNRSARSIDAGLNWDDEHLTSGGFVDGEYTVRLSGKRLADEGVVTSPPIQVVPDGGAVAPAGRVTSVGFSANVHTPIEIRLGTGPWLDRPGVWTAWRSLSQPSVRALERDLDTPGPRFIQWRVRLRPRANRAPVLKKARLNVALEPSCRGPLPPIEVDGPATVLPGRHFAHQGTSPRLALIRKHFKLDQVYALGRSEWDSLLCLAAWVGHHASNRVHDPMLLPAQYELLHTLELGHARRTTVMCGQLAFATVQVAAAFGHTGRVVLRGNHLVTEFWSTSHRKWAVVDPMDQVWIAEKKRMSWTGGYGGYYHAGDGVPLSAIELGGIRGKVARRHFVWSTQDFEERAVTVSRDLRWYRKEISYPERNNYTDCSEPVFSADVFRFSGHLKYRHLDKPLMPWYWLYTARRGDVEWTVGETSAFLTATSAGRVCIQLRSQLPNTVGFQITPAGSREVEVSGDVYHWRVRGPTGITIQAVNALGQTGPGTDCRLA